MHSDQVRPRLLNRLNVLRRVSSVVISLPCLENTPKSCCMLMMVTRDLRLNAISTRQGLKESARLSSFILFQKICNFRVTERALTSIRFLIRKHYCPEPRFRVEAPINVSSRCMRRQVSPRCGGVGGAACDRQFVYSR